jgi:hypothetical protein
VVVVKGPPCLPCPPRYLVYLVFLVLLVSIVRPPSEGRGVRWLLKPKAGCVSTTKHENKKVLIISSCGETIASWRLGRWHSSTRYMGREMLAVLSDGEMQSGKY